jgi:hypothetical protein
LAAPDAPNAAICQNFPANVLTLLGTLKLVYHYRHSGTARSKLLNGARIWHAARQVMAHDVFINYATEDKRVANDHSEFGSYVLALLFDEKIQYKTT